MGERAHTYSEERGKHSRCGVHANTYSPSSIHTQPGLDSDGLDIADVEAWPGLRPYGRTQGRRDTRRPVSTCRLHVLAHTLTAMPAAGLGRSRCQKTSPSSIRTRRRSVRGIENALK